MKTYKVKSLIKQMLRQHKGSFDEVAERLKCSPAYVRMLAKGDKKASWSLAELIRAKLKEDHK